MKPFYWLVLGGLTTWRLTHLLAREDGPGDLLVRLRRAVGNGFWGRLLDCFLCLSLWLSAPLAVLIGESWTERLLLWPGLSAFAILLERMGAQPSIPPPPAFYREDKEPGHELLRPEPDGSPPP